MVTADSKVIPTFIVSRFLTAIGDSSGIDEAFFAPPSATAAVGYSTAWQTRNKPRRQSDGSNSNVLAEQAHRAPLLPQPLFFFVGVSLQVCRISADIIQTVSSSSASSSVLTVRARFD
jgi:hypothetical protein